MTHEAWVFAAAFAVTLALWLVTLLAAAASKADLERAYLKLAAKLLRSEQENADLRRLVEDEPVPFVPAENAAFDAIVRGWDEA